MSRAHTVTATFVQAPNLTYTESHAPFFTLGQLGAAYHISVSNTAGGGPTLGTVTVTETIPAGLTFVSMSGGGWNCPTPGTTCTRSDALPSGMSYPDLVVTVNVASNAPSSVTNQVTLSGGGLNGSLLLTDPTSVVAGVPFDINGDGVVTVADVQQIMNEVLGVSALAHDENADGKVNVIDMQLVIRAALGH